MERLIVILGVVGVSLSAVFVRWSTAPSLVLATYRMAFAAALLTPLAWRRREEFRALRRRELGLSLLSGAFLGCHFACYFEALRWTSIASAVVLVDAEVLFVALATVLILRRRLSGRAWLAVLLAFGGSVTVALADGSAGADALRGDFLALAGALCMAVYTMLGAVCRRELSTTVYTWLMYASAAGTVLVFAPTPRDMAVFCTLLGHSVFSWGLKFLSPAFIATAKLLEPVFASVWGLFLFAERPGAQVILGGGVVLLGVVLYSREEA